MAPSKIAAAGPKAHKASASKKHKAAPGKAEDPAGKPKAKASPDKPKTLPKKVSGGHALPRLQFGVLALRMQGESVSVMLVTSRGTRRWIIPKGNPEKGKSGAEVGAIEAFEEAGVLGEVWNAPIGSYVSLKHLANGRVVPCAIEVYRMDVDEVLDDWPEKGQRQRCWATLDEAAMMVGEGGLVTLMLKLNAELIGH
jgi:8-oxo-dGTP pyrophosphatase MutT (NUDIX family)